jgi:hypothetical protein
MTNKISYYISVPQDILTNLKLDSFSKIIDSVKYLSFICDPDDITLENNYIDTSTGVEASINRILLKPKPRLKKFNLKFRESRYEFYLALEEIAKRSQRAYVNNESTQLLTMVDYNMPEYNDFVNRTNFGFTKRIGYIPLDSIVTTGNLKKTSYDESGIYFGNLISTSKISISFYDVKAYY